MRFVRAVRVLAAFSAIVALPLAAVGLGVLSARAKAEIEPGAVRVLAVLGLFMLALFVIMLSSAVHGAAVGVVTFVSLAIAVLLAGAATTMTYLADHGRTVSCTLLDVDRRVKAERHANGDGTYSTETSTYYDHRMDCGEGGPSTVTKNETLARIGDRFELTFDPADRVSPELADDVEDRDAKKWIAVVFLVLTIIVRVVHFIVLQARSKYR